MKYLILLACSLGVMGAFPQSLPDIQISRGYGLLAGEKQILVRSTGFCLAHELNNAKLLLLGGYVHDKGVIKGNYTIPLNETVFYGLRANSWYMGCARRFQLLSKHQGAFYLGVSLHWRKVWETNLTRVMHTGGWAEGWIESNVSSHPGLAVQLFYRVPLLKKLSLECAIQSRFYTQLSGPVHTAGLGLVYTVRRK